MKLSDRMEGSNGGALRLTATIKGKFEELGYE